MRNLRDPKTLLHPRTLATLRRYAKRRAQYKAKRKGILAARREAERNSPEAAAARQERKRKASARRSESYRRRKKLKAKAERLAMRLAEVAAKVFAAQERARLHELRSRQHASAKQGFLDGWHAPADLQDAEQWSKRYRKAFAEAREQRTKFESQLTGANPSAA